MIWGLSQGGGGGGLDECMEGWKRGGKEGRVRMCRREEIGRGLGGLLVRK